MTHLIDKDKAIAEIEKRKKYNHERAYLDRSSSMAGKEEEDKEILSIIDTLEVKEMDLEKEINKYISDNFFGSETMGFFTNRTKGEPDDQDIALCAEHFFELGLKAQKGE